MVAHGFNILYGQIVPPKNVDVSMIAPKSPAIWCAISTPWGTASRRWWRSTRMPAATPCGRHWRTARASGRRGRHPRDDDQGRDRDGQLRRAGGALRRRQRAGDGGVRDADEAATRLSGVLRVPARAEADRGSVLPGGLSLMRYSVSNTAEFGDYYAGRASSPTKPRRR